MTHLEYTDIYRYADGHPDMEPEAIGLNMTAPMTKVQLREFAVAHVRTQVEGYRRRQAREVEGRAAREAREAEVRAALEEVRFANRDRVQQTWTSKQRQAHQKAAAEKQQRREAERWEAEALITSEEFFQRLFDSPTSAVNSSPLLTARFSKHNWLRRDFDIYELREKFRVWCGDRFDSWFQRAKQDMEQSGPWSEREFLDVFYAGGQVKWAIDKFTADVASQTRLEVTEELLGTKFALGDGTLVTWGEATIVQQRKRIDMLSANAAGVVETAARHQEAIRMCEDAGVSCLNELAVQEAA